MLSAAVGLGLAAIAAAPAFAQTTGEDLQSRIQSLLAQITQLSQQLQQLRAQNQGDASFTSSVISGGICHFLDRTLSFGSQGDDVSSLQDFLHAQGFLNANPTGFFGALTQAALQKWQNSEGIDGIGVVGPLTRARIAARCGAAPSHEGTPPVQFKGDNGGNGEGDSNGNSQAPVISSFTGPSTLDVGATGTWTVSATDPQGGSLAYRVVWGDEHTKVLDLIAQLAEGTPFVVGTTFTHAYAAAGYYVVTVFARDSSGMQTRAFARVTVGTPSAGSQGLVTCTTDAMRCPNGQWVGRSGPQCQFVCPAATPTVSSDDSPGASGAGSCDVGGHTVANGATLASAYGDQASGTGISSYYPFQVVCKNGKWTVAAFAYQGSVIAPYTGTTSCQVAGQWVANGAAMASVYGDTGNTNVSGASYYPFQVRCKNGTWSIGIFSQYPSLRTETGTTSCQYAGGWVSNDTTLADAVGGRSASSGEPGFRGFYPFQVRCKSGVWSASI